MRLQEARRDLYRRLAKEQGYKSRAAFKLIEANEKYGFIGEGDRVADFGAAPGGWLQVCSRLVGQRGRVVGMDVNPIRLGEKNVRTIAMDVSDAKAAEEILIALEGPADTVLSDISPSVSGVWELDHIRQVDLTLRVLELSESVLRRRGSGFFKIFEGERSEEAREALRDRFRLVRTLRPHATRSASSELYYYCADWLGPAKLP